MGQSIKIVLVYLGQIPEYVFKNALYLTSTFPDIETYVVSDSISEIQNLESLGVKGFLMRTPSPTWRRLENLNAHDRGFRQNFWFKTVARFIPLLEFMEYFPNTPILHIEADVWISPNFPISKIELLGDKISYPLKSSSEGIASTLYIGSVIRIRELLQYCETSFERDNLSTDVSILGGFWNTDKEVFYNLPTGLKDVDFYQTWVSGDLRDLLSSNLDFFQGLFDASTLGIWYTGEDPRNAFGWRALFKEQNHPIRPSGWKLFFANDRLFLSKDGTQVEVFSLHIHSKDLRFFEYEIFKTRIVAISQMSGSRVIREYVQGQTPLIVAKTLAYQGLALFRRIRKYFR